MYVSQLKDEKVQALTIFSYFSIPIPLEEPNVFWRFQGDIEMEHWAKMGSNFSNHTFFYVLLKEKFLKGYISSLVDFDYLVVSLQFIPLKGIWWEYEPL